MLRPVLLVALAAVVAVSGHGYSGSSLKPVLTRVGLPLLYKPKYSLGGLEGYLKQSKFSVAKFTVRIQKYKSTIRRIVLPMRKQYKGVLGDLLQVAVLRYYGCEPTVNYKFPIGNYFRRYVKLTRIPSPIRYNAKYVNTFLTNFRDFLHKKVKPEKILLPAPYPKPAYPGYELYATLKSIGLPALSSPKVSLGGIVSYLKVLKISEVTIISRIQIYRSYILKLVLKYQGLYKGYELDLLKVAAIQYYCIPKTTKRAVSFSIALKQALKIRINYGKYSTKYVSVFLARFSKILYTVRYPGYKLLPAIKRIGLPKLYKPKYVVGGLYAYLKVVKISQVTLIKRITKYSGKIRKLVQKYKGKYKKYELDFLQAAAIRYYCLPKPAKQGRFRYAFKQALKIIDYQKYNTKYVSVFLARFSKVFYVPVRYPGYKLLPAIKRIGLPTKLYKPKYILGGLNAYLKVVKVSQVTLIKRITKYSRKIRELVLKYKGPYNKYQLDLLMAAAIRFYCLPENKYGGNFRYAFKYALKVRVTYQMYSIKYVRSFLSSLSKYLTKPIYFGYKLKPLLANAGLPKLTLPQYSLPGLIAYLQANKYSEASLSSRIRKYAPKIKAIILPYKKKYTGFRADLLQLCAIRYYSLPSIIRKNVRFGYIFQKYLSSQNPKQYNAYYVKQFLNGFIKYIRKYQLKKYSGSLW